MESKIFVIALNIAIFSCLTQSGIALSCYQCDTKKDDSCTDASSLNKSSITPEECVPDTSLSESGLTPTCLKILTTNYKHCSIVEHVVRKCIWIYENEDPCASEAILSPYVSDRTANQTCTTCNDKDGCNDANSLKLLSTFVFFGTMLSAFLIL